MQRQRRLDEAGDAGGALGMADVGLDRADERAAAAGRPPLPQHGAERAELDRVADPRAGAVRLDVAHAAGSIPASA